MTMTTAPRYTHPGRRSALAKAVDLADEMLATFREAMPSGGGSDSLLGGPTGPRTLGGSTNLAIDVEAAIGRINSERSALVSEKDRTVEGSIPDEHRAAHDMNLLHRDNQIAHEVVGARNAVAQFLHQKDIRTAARYALQLIETPGRIDQLYAKEVRR